MLGSLLASKLIALLIPLAKLSGSSEYLLVIVHSALLVAAESDVSLLVDVREGRVEGLTVAIVECSGLTVVFAHDHDEVLHLGVFRLASVLAIELEQTDSRYVLHSLLPSLGRLLASLDREWVLAFVTRMVTPVCTLGLRLGAFLILRLARQAVFPCNATAQVVPVNVTVDGNEAEEAPEDPPHLADHPHVRLTHVVRNVKHHFAQ